MFKIKEFCELMGGKDSDFFEYFKNLMLRGFMELRKYVDEFIYILKAMLENSDLPCFQ